MFHGQIEYQMPCSIAMLAMLEDINRMRGQISQILIGEPSINGSCSIAILSCQRVGRCSKYL